MVKPGIKTTEFWATVIFNLAIFISTLTSSLPGKDQLIAASVVNGLYILSRSLVKFKSAPSASAVLAYVEAFLQAEAAKQVAVINNTPVPAPEPLTVTVGAGGAGGGTGGVTGGAGGGSAA